MYRIDIYQKLNKGTEILQNKYDQKLVSNLQYLIFLQILSIVFQFSTFKDTNIDQAENSERNFRNIIF